MLKLPQLRKQIDRLDDRIVGLLNRRMGLARKIGDVKFRNGSKVYNAQREQRLLARLSDLQSGPLTASQLRSIYRQILEVSRAHQQQIFEQARQNSFSIRSQRRRDRT